MTKTKTQTQPTSDREAVRVLAIELGAREVARRLGINESTVLSWARRYDWKLPRRKGGGNGKNALTLAIKPGDALIAAHQELESTTKTGLMQTLAKAVRALAERDALPVENITQFKDACLAAARIYGWKGESQVNVAVDARTVVVTEETRKRLQQKLKEIQEDDNGESSAATTLLAPQTQLQANVDAGNSPSGAHAAAQDSIFIMPGGEGIPVSRDTLRHSISPSMQEFLEAEPVRDEPRNRNSVGW